MPKLHRQEMAREPACTSVGINDYSRNTFQGIAHIFTDGQSAVPWALLNDGPTSIMKQSLLLTRSDYKSSEQLTELYFKNDHELKIFLTTCIFTAYLAITEVFQKQL